MSEEIIKFEAGGTEVQLGVDYTAENMWASQAQIAQIFGIDRTRVTRHVNNIFKDEEIDKESNVRKTHIGSTTRPTSYYSLDVILSVGYRTNSKNAIAFRRWANTVLKSHLTKGYSVNEKKLADLNLALQILERSNIPELSGTASLIADYTQALFLLDSYDRKELPEVDGNLDTWQLTYSEARGFLESLPDFKKSELFAKERTGQFAGILEQIYAGFGETEFYPTVEKKAANLLYFVVKDHPFYDGNKRSAAALFV
jgi:hypothetical protein